jgi:hypothetical protein
MVWSTWMQTQTMGIEQMTSGWTASWGGGEIFLFPQIPEAAGVGELSVVIKNSGGILW